MSARGFPVLNPPAGCPPRVTWSSLDNDHAIKVHGKPLGVLAQRGGLTYADIFRNVRRLQFGDRVKAADALDLCRRIEC